MLRHLKELIVDLNLNEEKYSNYILVATRFRKFDESKNDFVSIEMPKNEKEYKTCEKIDNPIFEIVIDENDPELCCIIKYLPDKINAPNESMKLSSFLKMIFGFPEYYSEHEVLSSAWEHLSDNCNGRVDIPISGVFVDEENHRICLIEAAVK